MKVAMIFFFLAVVPLHTIDQALIGYGFDLYIVRFVQQKQYLRALAWFVVLPSWPELLRKGASRKTLALSSDGFLTKPTPRSEFSRSSLGEWWGKVFVKARAHFPNASRL